jgi:two-component system, response regulator YesN
VLHDNLLKSVVNKRFEESCDMIEEVVYKLFCTFRGANDKYMGFKLLFMDLFALIPCINKNYISFCEKKYALCDAICNDPIQAEFWMFDVVDEVYKQRSIQMYQHFIKVFSYIDDNINKEIVMNMASAYANLSMSYLSRIFNKEMGVGFSNYVNIKKIRKAKQILKSSDIPVNDIAFNVGYNEPNYFCKVFRRFEDSTPTQYRDSIRVIDLQPVLLKANNE